jgi:tetratricopeptide (TPR) repeat protein
LRLQPDFVDAHFNLGNAYRTLGRHAEAVDCYRQALRLQPDNAGARLNLGVALSEQGRLDEASGELEDLLRSRSDFVPAMRRGAGPPSARRASRTPPRSGGWQPS